MKEINFFFICNLYANYKFRTDGVGLAAPQVGVNVQLMVFNSSGEPGEGEEIVLVNPVIYKASDRTTIFNEGCLSFPGIFADVEVRSTTSFINITCYFSAFYVTPCIFSVICMWHSI